MKDELLVMIELVGEPEHMVFPSSAELSVKVHSSSSSHEVCLILFPRAPTCDLEIEGHSSFVHRGRQ